MKINAVQQLVLLMPNNEEKKGYNYMREESGDVVNTGCLCRSDSDAVKSSLMYWLMLASQATTLLSSTIRLCLFHWLVWFSVEVPI